MDLIGEKVLHRTSGEGTIIDAQINEENRGYITIEFPSKTVPFAFPKQFHDSYLTAVNSELQEWIDSLKPLVLPEPTETTSTTTSTSTNPSLLHTFLVFQGKTYDQERLDEYMWAPITNSSGMTHHSWERLSRVRDGDIIVHVAKGYIRAFSRARGRCYNSPNPFGGLNPWDRTGRRVDCDYVPLIYPIRTKDFVNEIDHFCRNMSYPPFRPGANGNMGYLYDLPSKLTKVFIIGAIQKNTFLKKVSWIDAFLK